MARTLYTGGDVVTDTIAFFEDFDAIRLAPTVNALAVVLVVTDGGTLDLRDEVAFTDQVNPAGPTRLNVSFTGGAVTFTGGDGADTVSGSGGADRIEAGEAGDLILNLGAGSTAFGGGGSDSIDATGAVGGRVLAYGGDGDDAFAGRLSPGGGASAFFGGAGSDDLNLRAGLIGDWTFYGGAEAFTAVGPDGQVLHALDVETVLGFIAVPGPIGVTISRADFGTGQLSLRPGLTFDGTAGDDRIGPFDPGPGGDFATFGDDAIGGLGGDDAINGARGDDRLWGGAGDDRLDGGLGDDALWGGAGDDAYVVDSAGDQVSERGDPGLDAGGSDRILAFVDFGLVEGVERLDLRGAAVTGTGGSGDDALGGSAIANTLLGLGGADRLSGAGGGDDLRGGEGEDRLLGGEGDDLLDGGEGGDMLRGGAGADVFVLSAPDGAADRFADFVSGLDRVVLDAAAFAGLLGDPGGAPDPGQLARGTRALDGDDRLVHDAATGRLWWDADGSGAGAAVLVARLGAGTALAEGDLLLL